MQPQVAAHVGIARHVCPDGCQFAILGVVPAVRERLRFSLASGLVITGSVSWVLGDRIALAFDQPIGARTMSDLSGHLRSLTEVPLSHC
jgi:trans-2-enoyl-CoA reductase